MTYVVNESCIKCKLMDCVEVCPVDCFYEGENMLVIHPDECIDCGVCEPECPVEAIKADTEAGARKVARRQRGIRQDLAQHHGEENASGRFEGVGRQTGQRPNIFRQPLVKAIDGTRLTAGIDSV